LTYNAANLSFARFIQVKLLGVSTMLEIDLSLRVIQKAKSNISQNQNLPIPALHVGYGCLIVVLYASKVGWYCIALVVVLYRTDGVYG